MKRNQAFEILSHASDAHVARIITENMWPMSAFGVRRVARRLRHGVPVAKIVGFKWFYGMRFRTNMHTLDPRPDTETLVEAVLADNSRAANVRMLDLGTGTGCILGAILSNMPNTTGVAIDVSRRAVRVARHNMHDIGVASRVNVRRASFNNRNMTHERFDIIVSNPPYISRGDTRVDVGASYDPACALYAPNNGLAAYESIAKNARAWIADGGRIYLEIGRGQMRAVRQIFARHGWQYVRGIRDLGGVMRVLVFC